RGIDEADKVKIGKNHVAVVTRENEIKILDRESFAVLGSIEIPAGTSAELYLVGESLIVVNKSATEFSIDKYKLEKGSAPSKKSASQNFVGTLRETRLRDNFLVVVANAGMPYAVEIPRFNWQGDIPSARKNPIRIEDDAVNSVPCTAIAKIP